MGLETTTYIDGLVTTNPTGSDGKSQGDDHLRLIKSAIKNTFPNVTGAVTVTHTQLNAIGTPGVINFTGMCTMFVGTQAQIPAGWQLCNGVGTLTNGTAIPDLRSKFIMASTGDAGLNPSGSSGGAATHTHTVTVDNHTLTLAQIPSHTHSFSLAYAPSLVASSGSSSGTFWSYQTSTTGSAGGDGGHNHTASTAAGANTPPYYALAIIVKL